MAIRRQSAVSGNHSASTGPSPSGFGTPGIFAGWDAPRLAEILDKTVDVDDARSCAEAAAQSSKVGAAAEWCWTSRVSTKLSSSFLVVEKVGHDAASCRRLLFSRLRMLA